jgi:hypothetical protein
MFNSSVFELQHPEGAVLFNLSAFADGPTSVVDRISGGVAGFYAWFRVYQFRDDANEFADDLVDAIRSPKFQSRTGDVPPYYEVSLSSKSYIPEGKEKALREALKDEEFRTSMKHAMAWSMLFQAPLYVGKSSNIKSRVGQHLKNGSPLRQRLGAAGIEMDRTYLLIVPTPVQSQDHGATDAVSDDLDGTSSPYELLFEEVFSRLFNPTFTIRLG